MKKYSLWSFLIVYLMMFVVGCGKSTNLEGKVVDGLEQPLAKVKVVAKMSQPIKGYEEFETTTGIDGSFKFGKLFPTAEYQLTIYSEGGKERKKFIIDSGPKGETKILPKPVVLRFKDSKEGLLLDTLTNLMWAANGISSYISWENAKPYCENYEGGGYKDWRMPTQDELAMLSSGGAYRDGYIWFNAYPSIWASDSRGSEVALFDFVGGGERLWKPPSTQNITALPVRKNE